jgi:hypothetical protein
VYGVLQGDATPLQLLPFIAKLLELLTLRAETRLGALLLLGVGGERRGGEQRGDQQPRG